MLRKTFGHHHAQTPGRQRISPGADVDQVGRADYPSEAQTSGCPTAATLWLKTITSGNANATSAKPRHRHCSARRQLTLADLPRVDQPGGVAFAQRLQGALREAKRVDALAIAQKRQNAYPDTKRILTFNSQGIGASPLRSCGLPGIDDFRAHGLCHEGAGHLFLLGCHIPKVVMASAHQTRASLKRCTRIRQRETSLQGGCENQDRRW